MKGTIADDSANVDKFKRLRERKYITEDNKVNIMVAKSNAEEFFEKIPSFDEKYKRTFADYALQAAEVIARDYPRQMRDLVISWNAGGFVSNTVAVMVMDILYGNGTFKELTDNEKVTSNLIMFCDTLPTE
jgi:glutamine phosphoribosylpyrophosphate amidotransferase